MEAPGRADIKLPRISVVTPCFNHVAFVEQTILSVLGQNYPDLEYIVIDGASSDGSIEIIQQYAQHLTYWESTPDRGQAHALNKGFERATGDVLCWINSDDYFLPGIFSVVARSFLTQTPPGLIYGRCLMFDEERGWAKIRQPVSPFDSQTYRLVNYIDQPSAFWSRALWRATGTLNESFHYAFDWDWFIRASANAEFESVPLLLSAYRIHAGQKTGTGGAVRLREIRSIVKRYAGEHWDEMYQKVDESILPSLVKLRGIGKVRGMWRVSRLIERLVRHAWCYRYQRSYGYAAMQNAIDVLDR